MRILFLTQWFQPELMLKGLPFALELKRLGHEVEVLTGFPNYPTGRVMPPYEIRPRMVETMDGIRVTRVPLYPSHDRSAIRRSLNYLSFAASAATIGIASVRRPDVVYAYQPPATAVLPAWLYRVLAGVPYVLDIQDLWPDTLTATGMFRSPLGLKAMGVFCDELHRRAAHIVVLSPGFRRTLVARGVPDDRLTVIPNWAEDTIMIPAPRDEGLARDLGLSGRFNVMFAGNMGLAQGLDTILDSAEQLRTRCPIAQYIFVGTGLEKERIQRQAMDRHLDNVRFMEHQSLAKMPALFALADVMLVHLNDSPLFRIAIPSKVQAYMAAGRPILCAVAGDATDLIDKAGAGICCPPENPSALTDSVCRLAQYSPDALKALGTNGLRYYERELCLKVGVARFAALLSRVAASHSRHCSSW